MCSTPCRCILTLINIIFGIAGLTITILGALMIWAKPIVEKLVNELITRLGTGMEQQLRDNIDEIVDVCMRLSSQVGLVVLIAGVIILIISFLGCCGACCNNKCFLFLYIALVSVIAVAHIIVIIIWFAKPDLPMGLINKVLNETVYKYESIESGTPESLFLGMFMKSYNCCGFINGEDFRNSLNFKSKDTISGIRFDPIAYPVPCCKNIPVSTPVFGLCPNRFTSDNSNKDVGCSEKVQTDLLPLLNMIAYISLGVLGLEILLIIMAVFAVKV